MGRGRWIALTLFSATLATAATIAGPDLREVVTGLLTVLTVLACALWPGTRDRRGPISYFTAGGALFVLGALMRVAITSVTGEVDPFPTVADLVFFAGWGMLIAGSVQLARLRRSGPDQDALIDGLIVAAAGAVTTWSIWLAPYVLDGAVPVLDRLTNVTYSLLTLTLLACCVRLAIGPGARTISYYLLAAAVFILGGTDLLTSISTVNGASYEFPQRLNPWVWTLFGAALTHPSVAMLTKPPSEPAARLTKGRTVLIGIALMVPVGLVSYLRITDQADPDWRMLLVGAGIMTVLVLRRTAGLIRSQERAVELQRIQREANADLAAASSRHAMHRAALRAVVRLAGDAPDLRVSLAQAAGQSLRVLDAMGHDAEAAVGTSIAMDRVPGAIVDGLAELRLAAIDDAEPIDLGATHVGTTTASVLVAPLSSQHDLSGALILTTRNPVSDTLRQSVETLASTVSLALESAVLTENLLRRRSERRFRALVENSSDIVLVVDVDRKITFASPAAHRLLGLQEKALLQSHPARWVHPDDWPTLAAVLDADAPVHAEDDQEVEVRIRHVDGTYRWFEIRTRDLSNDPEIQGLVVTAREISDRKSTEQQLASSEARFRALVQSSTDIVAVVGDDGCFSYLSPAIQEMLGYAPEELLGTPAMALVAPSALGEFQTEYPQLTAPLAGDERLAIRRAEAHLHHRNGELRTVDMTVTDLRHDPAVGGVVLNARDITVRKALEADLRFQALHDTLTGLANRTMFTHETAAALRDPTAARIVGALFIDLDDFKTVNDSLGHAVGDQLLQEVSTRLITSLSSEDVAARLGGDEFAVLVVDAATEAGVVSLAETVLTIVAQPYRIQGREIRVTASIGIAFATEEGTDAEVLLRNADVAMYLAKDRGKNRYATFESHMHTSVFERLELKADLVRAIDDGQLRCYYQPIVSLQTGQMTGVEALVRWEHPTRGMLQPDAFIPLAEDTGLVVPLGKWVLREACQQLRIWQLALPATSTLSMSVNLSVRQLAHDQIVRDVRQAVDDAALDPSTLTLEITETTLMHDTEVTRHRLAELRRIGVSLAVDDFGTGYSSLQYVQRFPIDIIKIDRSFVTGLGTNPGDGAVVQSMIELSQRLGVHTVAEGIDRPEQVTLLQSLGADLGQGYLFSEPVPPSEIDAMLAASPSGIPHVQLQ